MKMRIKVFATAVASVLLLVGAMSDAGAVSTSERDMHVQRESTNVDSKAVGYIPTEDEQEADKLYRGNAPTWENPVSVVFTDRSTSGDNAVPANLDVSASFEQSVFTSNARSLGRGLSGAYADYSSETARRTVSIDKEAYELLVAFTDDLHMPFVNKQPVDLSVYYDVSTPERSENLALFEEFAFFDGASFSNDVISFRNTLDVKDVIPQEEGYLRVDFRLSVDFDDGSGRALYHTAYLAYTGSGYKIVKFWSNDNSFPVFVEFFQENSSPDLVRSQSATLGSVGQMLLDKRNENMADRLRMPPNQDSFGESFDSFTDADLQRGVTSSIPYDRTAVRNAARKYATNFNPRFEVIEVWDSEENEWREKDCTNFASQCMWQSPDWKFDTIGGHDDYKWYCVKNSNDVYVPTSDSWSSVGKLWTYAQENDNPSLAGTVYGISCSTSGYTLDNVQIGDIIQLYEPGEGWHHSVVVTVINDRDFDGIKVCAHSNDHLDYALDNYLGDGEMFTEYRIIHVNQFITGYN